MNQRHLLLYTVCAAAAITNGFLRGAERFDHQVRNLIFAGMAGDQEAFQKGMKICEDAIAANPKHAEALVWHGAGLFFQSGQYFQKQDTKTAMEYYGRGIGEMDRAVEIAPENLGVRIPRAAVLLSAASAMNESDPTVKDFARKALADYEKTIELQQAAFDQLGTHPRGELLQGLANANRILGHTEQATVYYTRLKTEMPGTPYAKRAEKWLTTGQLTAKETGCIGCHVAK